jgi:hypothetical protein
MEYSVLQLRLDVEEFIAPVPPASHPSEADAAPAKSSSQNASPFQRSKSTTAASKLLIKRRDKASGKASLASRRSASSTSPRRLRKCESIDFKEILAAAGSASPKAAFPAEEETAKSKRNPAAQIFSSARKYSEAFQRKYLSRSTAAKIRQQQQQPLQQSQVSRRGRRPLSAFLTRTSMNEVIGGGGAEDDLDSDSEEESARRLQRSKIIQSFLREQADQEANNNNHHGSVAVSTKNH